MVSELVSTKILHNELNRTKQTKIWVEVKHGVKQFNICNETFFVFRSEWNIIDNIQKGTPLRSLNAHYVLSCLFGFWAWTIREWSSQSFVYNSFFFSSYKRVLQALVGYTLAMSIQWCACLVPSTILSKFGSILV